MPSVRHEAIASVLREHPALVATLLQRSGLVAVPAHDAVASDSADLGAAIASELRADGLFRFDHDGVPVLIAVLEVQFATDDDKLFAWPAYAASARRRYRCDAVVVVFTPSRAVAAWARGRIPIGPGAGYFQAIVIGPDEMPAITDADEARQHPELATLSAIAHGHDADAQRAATIAAVAKDSVLALEGERGGLYYDLILASLGEAARRALDMMFPRNYQYQDEGLRKANAAGIVQGKAEGLLAVLEARDLSVSAEQRARIQECKDLTQLDRWLRVAATTDSVDQLLTH